MGTMERQRATIFFIFLVVLLGGILAIGQINIAMSNHSYKKEVNALFRDYGISTEKIEVFGFYESEDIDVYFVHIESNAYDDLSLKIKKELYDRTLEIQYKSKPRTEMIGEIISNANEYSSVENGTTFTMNGEPIVE